MPHMQPYLLHKVQNNHFLLTGSRVMFWEEQRILVLSDLHIGKSGHFRKNGIGIPQTVCKEDLQRLFAQIRYFNPASLLVIGDLFHSTENREHDLFVRWRKDLSGLSVILVKGNHDILPDAWYRRAGIDCFENTFTSGEFSFTHDVECHKPAGKTYCFSGHVHPGIVMHGNGKQTLRFPCFHFGIEHAVLPAFGKFTGLHTVKPKRGDHVYALVDEQVMKIQ